jgi:hypothetical protein
MHSRTDAASLHAACTSACDEVDPLRLQTDWGLFRNKKKPSNETVQPTEVLCPDVGRYFTHDLAQAQKKQGHKYGIVTFECKDDGTFDNLDTGSRYFQIYNQSLADENFFLDVNVSRSHVSRTVLFNGSGPVDIAQWNRRRLFEHHDIVYIKNPNDYFAPHNQHTQNKWPVDMPRKDVHAAILNEIRRIWSTDASTNPYIVQHVRADPTPGPDAAWQTDGWPGLKYFKRKSRQVAPAPHTKEASAPNTIMASTPDNFKPIMLKKPKHLRTVLDTGQKMLDFHQNTAEKQFEFFKDTFWTSENSDHKIACAGLKNGHTVYMCFYKVNQYLLQCYIFDNAFDKKGKNVLTKNPMDYITQRAVPGIFKVPRNNPNVLWFTYAPDDTR